MQSTDGSLRGRIVIITGGARGLGLAYARRLDAAGARVVVVDVHGEAVDTLRDGGDRLTAIHADVTDRDQVDAVVEAIDRDVGPVDVLINNAGGALLPRADFETMSTAQWHLVLDANLTSQWICSAAVAPSMKRRRSGKIINVSSAVVGRGQPAGMVPYIAAKAGVLGLTRALAHELGPFGITVNAIAPGYTPVSTPKSVHNAGQAELLREQMIAEQCLKRTETPDDLCGAVEFLASSSSDFITGQVLNVDGGWVMT